jgi:hypothetical protein
MIAPPAPPASPPTAAVCSRSVGGLDKLAQPAAMSVNEIANVNETSFIVMNLRSNENMRDAIQLKQALGHDAHLIDSAGMLEFDRVNESVWVFRLFHEIVA